MNSPLSIPAYCRPRAHAAFAEQLPHIDTTAGLFRAAFAISQHERPTADIARAEAVIDSLSETVRRRVHTTSTQARLAHLHDVLFDVIGFRGNVDEYYDPANSYLPDVLRTRRGLPISLVLIYKAVAEGVGLKVHGINAPGHFLAAVETNDGYPAGEASLHWAFVDPFYGGTLLDEQDILRRISETTGSDTPPTPQWRSPATGRQWLTRMLSNLQAAFASAGRERDLLAMQELQSLLDN
jgi:regulator of sirC expression with transglutaminase-like and TPR domain